MDREYETFQTFIILLQREKNETKTEILVYFQLQHDECVNIPLKKYTAASLGFSVFWSISICKS